MSMISQTWSLGMAPRKIQVSITIFLVVLSAGYFTGILYVDNTTSLTPSGIVENYNGNEADLDADIMKFKKSEKEIISIIHSHVITLSVVFFVLALLVYFSDLKDSYKTFLMTEPMISLLATFGGIYLIWAGLDWMTYVVIASGTLMHLSFLASVVFIMRSMWFPKTQTHLT